MTWQEIGRTCGSACRCPCPGSRIVVPSSKYVLLLGLKKQYIFAKRDDDQGKMSGCVEVDGCMVYVAEVLVVIQYSVLVVTNGYTGSVVVYRVACTK